jgi:uncharacterized protein YbaP (TraB family)
MHSIKYYFFSFFAGLFVLQSQTSCSSSKTTSPAQSSDKALLWEISVPGSKEVSYVFGTIHMIPSEDYFLPEGTMSAFDKSKKIFFEIDMAQMSDPAALMGMMSKMYMKDNKTLKDLLNEKDYKTVTDFFQKKGLPIFFLERIKPMFLTVLTYGDVSPGSLQQGGDIKSYEFEFMEMAKNTGKATGGLETIDFQLSVFDKIPEEAQAKMLISSIESGSGADDQMNEMVKIYKDQDIEKLVNMIGEEESGISEFEDILLVDRNQNWIPIMIEESKKQTSFFAVGAGHLGGSKGVLALLRKSGVKVRPVKL